MVRSGSVSAVDLFLALAIVLAAAGVRAGYLTWYCDQGANEGPFPVQEDQREDLSRQVRHVEANEGLRSRAPFATEEELSAAESPGYAGLLALADRPSHDLELTYRRIRWAQLALGALTAGWVYAFTRRAFHSRLAAVLAGLLAVVHPFWVFNTAEINDGVLATFLLMFCLFLGTRGIQRGGALTGLLYGLSLGALCLVRAPLLPFAFIALVAYLWRCRMLTSGWLYGIVAFIGFFLALLPWHIRNYQAFGEVLPIVDSAYFHLWEGNNPRASGTPESEDMQKLALRDAGGPDAERLASLRQPERYRLLANEIVREITNHPGDTMLRRLRAGVAFVFGARWLEDSRLHRGSMAAGAPAPGWLGRWATALLAGSLFLMVFLGGLGWRWSFAWRWEAMPSSLAIVWLPLPYVLSHATWYAGPRLPLDGLLLSYVGLVLACLMPGMAKRLLRSDERAPGQA